jgi:hypothetical protein
VVLVGDRTYGKPVGQYGLEFCDKVLAPVSFSLTNANGAADYFGGLEPTCVAADDLDRQLGDPAEASLREAFVYIDTGRCSSSAAGRVQGRRIPATTPLPGDGWQQLVNAH